MAEQADDFGLPARSSGSGATSRPLCLDLELKVEGNVDVVPDASNVRVSRVQEALTTSSPRAGDARQVSVTGSGRSLSRLDHDDASFSIRRNHARAGLRGMMTRRELQGR